MHEAQGEKGDGLTYGLIDEFAMLLSVFERNQNSGGQYSIDKARFLTW